LTEETGKLPGSADDSEEPVDPPAFLDRVCALLGDAVTQRRDFRGDATVVVAPERIVEVVTKLRDEPAFRFDFLSDLSAVDYLPHGREPRFEVVYHLYSTEHHHRLRVKAPVTEEDPLVPTVTGLWPIADWLEREVWDMFGIRFEGHPDLRRLLMYEAFQGHPLRKDYPLHGEQPLVQLRPIPGEREG
jgi:NADH-quinone oxidoreductase subunit C